MDVHDLPTPSLLVDADAFEHNVATMSAALPGDRLRPHVKAFKSTALAAALADAGHRSFCCATMREMEGMAAAGLGDDLLLANEVADASRLGALAASGTARVTVAVDSEPTVEAAVAGGVTEVLIDVNVGLPRCGCDPADAGRLADLARAKGLTVRGTMGYEGHVVGIEDRGERERKCRESMEVLATAQVDVGGEVVSAGGTGTYDINTFATEIQAGSFTLMDGAYAALDIPFRRAAVVWTTVISVNVAGWAVCDAGLKALGMDHGNPTLEGTDVWFCPDEHTTFGAGEAFPVRVGDRLRLLPEHIDPTVAKHERLHVVRDDEVVDTWDVDLRGW